MPYFTKIYICFNNKNLREKNSITINFPDKVVELARGGSVINGATLSSVHVVLVKYCTKTQYFQIFWQCLIFIV